MVQYVDLLVILSLLFPFFAEGYNFFLPFYKEKLEPTAEEDLLHLRVNRSFLGLDVVILKKCLHIENTQQWI